MDIESAGGIYVAVPEALTVFVQPIDRMVRDQEIELIAITPAARTLVRYALELSSIYMELAVIFVSIELQPRRIETDQSDLQVALLDHSCTVARQNTRRRTKDWYG